MELSKIENLLESYFGGATDLGEEEILMEYFNGPNVADHLMAYKPIFEGLLMARAEKSRRDFKLETKNTTGIIGSRWYAIAAMLVVIFGILGFFITQPRLSAEEKEALIAFENSKKAMILLSENLNKGTQQLQYVDQFRVEKNKIWKKN